MVKEGKKIRLANNLNKKGRSLAEFKAEEKESDRRQVNQSKYIDDGDDYGTNGDNDNDDGYKNEGKRNGDSK
jgi:hypothetical protein